MQRTPYGYCSTTEGTLRFNVKRALLVLGAVLVLTLATVNVVDVVKPPAHWTLSKTTRVDESDVRDSHFIEAGAAFGQIPMKLWQVSLFNCLSGKYKSHNDVDWRYLPDVEAFSGRWRCYCLEERPTDYNNCFSRFINTTVYRFHQPPKGPERVVILLDNVGSAVDDFRVDNSFEPTEHYVSLYSTRPCGNNKIASHKTWVGNLSIPTCGDFHLNYTTTAPYNEPFSFANSPVLLAPLLLIQQNHYHSIAGTTGALQYAMSVNAINKHYYDQEVRRRNGTSADNNKEAAPPLIRGPQRSFNKVHSLDSSSPRITLTHRGSCSLMNFSSVDDADLGWSGNGTATALLPSAGHRLPPSYLSREVLIGYDLSMSAKPKTEALGTIGWFGRREGYCNLAIPTESYATAADLWVNMIGKHLTAQWLLRRKDSPNPADIITADEYLNYCPLQVEEAIAGRWAVDRLTEVLNAFAPSVGPSIDEVHAGESIQPAQPGSTPRRCMEVPRPPTVPGSKAEVMCVLVIGRPVQPGGFRTRGLPPHVEKTILGALVMPLDGPGIAPLTPTPLGEKESPWWGWDNATRSARCDAVVPGVLNGCPKGKEAFLAMPPKDKSHTSAKDMLEQLNLDAGLKVCATPSLSPAFKYECLNFPASSPYFNASQRSRTDFTAVPVAEQFAQIRAANLFIFEEGAPLAWALTAKAGSTFVCVYNSNLMRYDGDRGRWRTVQKVGNNTMVFETLEPAKRLGKFRPATDFFVTMPHLVGKVRLIILAYQYSRWPSMAKLREVFDLPFEPETYVITCECDHTRAVPWSLVRPICDSIRGS